MLPLEHSLVWNLCSRPGPGLRAFPRKDQTILILLLSSSTTQESFPALGGILWNNPKWPRARIWNDLKKGDLNEKYAQDAPGFPSGGEDSLVPADSQEQAPFQGSTEPHLH